MTRNRFLKYLIACVWLPSGLLCKVLDLVPRHRQIVARILGNAHAAAFTTAIGLAEIGMAVWIVSGIKPRLNAITQVVVIAAMNTLEVILAPDLLLWGRWNALYAVIFILLILYSEFYPANRQPQPL